MNPLKTFINSPKILLKCFNTFFSALSNLINYKTSTNKIHLTGSWQSYPVGTGIDSLVWAFYNSGRLSGTSLLLNYSFDHLFYLFPYFALLSFRPSALSSSTFWRSTFCYASPLKLPQAHLRICESLPNPLKIFLKLWNFLKRFEMLLKLPRFWHESLINTLWNLLQYSEIPKKPSWSSPESLTNSLKILWNALKCLETPPL